MHGRFTLSWVYSPWSTSCNSDGSSDAVGDLRTASVIRGSILISLHSYQGLTAAFGLLCAGECSKHFYAAVGFSFESCDRHSDCLKSFRCCSAQKVN